MQQQTIMLLRHLFRLQLLFQLCPSFIHPKYWHSLSTRRRFSSDEMKRFATKKGSWRYQKFWGCRELVLARRRRVVGVRNLGKRLLESTLMSSFVFFLLNQLRKRTMMSIKCMTMMKAWIFWLSRTILTRRRERLRMQRQEKYRMQLMAVPRWRGSSSSRYLQVSYSLSKSKKTMQQMTTLISPSPWTPEMSAQAQQAKSTHQKTTICQTLTDLSAGLWVSMVRHWDS